MLGRGKRLNENISPFNMKFGVETGDKFTQIYNNRAHRSGNPKIFFKT